MTFARQGWIAVFSLFFAVAPKISAQVRLDLEHQGHSASVRLSGEADREYVLESAPTGVSGENWTGFSTFILTNATRTFIDPNAATGGRFFRARERSGDEIDWAANFRLIDQTSKSRELYYYASMTTLKGMALVFVEGDYAGVAAKIHKLKTNSLFKTSIQFWGIDTNPTTTRTNIATAAAAAGIDWPIFHDPLQLVARAFDAHYNGEVILVDRAMIAVAYRGVIEDDAGNAYLGTALTNLVRAETINTRRMEPVRNKLTVAVRPVADYATEIAPIIKNRCVVCHSPDNIAPMAFTSYEDVVDYADGVKDEILSSRMPPWHADANYGKFANDISLPPAEKSKLIDWVNAGMPRGAGADPLAVLPPTPPKWPVELGPPDQIVKIPVQSVPSSGTIAYRYIHANATNTTDKWLRAAIVRPSNSRVVHHYIVWEGHSNFAQLSGIATYVPGKNDQAFPAGTGILLKANSPLTFNTHYTATGTAETDQPELALWYAPTPPPRVMRQAAPLNFFFSVPPRTADFEVATSQSFSSAATLFAFSPHMHVRGMRMRFDLALPDGSKRTLLSVPNYDFHWQSTYTLETPLDVPAGARIDVVGSFDNSAQNHHNPNPNVSVGWGEQSWEEMFIGYIEYANR